MLSNDAMIVVVGMAQILAGADLSFCNAPFHITGGSCVLTAFFVVVLFVLPCFSIALKQCCSIFFLPWSFFVRFFGCLIFCPTLLTYSSDPQN